MCEQEIPFSEFVMTCARAMGACILMRDEPLDAPIPESFPEDDYHSNALKEWEAKLIALSSIGEGLMGISYGAELKSAEIQSLKESLVKYQAQDARLKGMLEQVQNWNPPTKDHEGLKKFMTEQLTISMGDSDFYIRRIEELEAKDPIEFYREAVKSAKWNVDYHAEQIEKNRERTQGRNNWIRALRNSLQS